MAPFCTIPVVYIYCMNLSCGTAGAICSHVCSHVQHLVPEVAIYSITMVSGHHSNTMVPGVDLIVWGFRQTVLIPLSYPFSGNQLNAVITCGV